MDRFWIYHIQSLIHIGQTYGEGGDGAVNNSVSERAFMVGIWRKIGLLTVCDLVAEHQKLRASQ